jgi:hypothetical protein
LGVPKPRFRSSGKITQPLIAEKIFFDVRNDRGGDVGQAAPLITSPTRRQPVKP